MVGKVKFRFDIEYDKNVQQRLVVGSVRLYQVTGSLMNSLMSIYKNF